MERVKKIVWRKVGKLGESLCMSLILHMCMKNVSDYVELVTYIKMSRRLFIVNAKFSMNFPQGIIYIKPSIWHLLAKKIKKIACAASTLTLQNHEESTCTYFLKPLVQNGPGRKNNYVSFILIFMDSLNFVSWGRWKWKIMAIIYPP